MICEHLLTAEPKTGRVEGHLVGYTIVAGEGLATFLWRTGNGDEVHHLLADTGNHPRGVVPRPGLANARFFLSEIVLVQHNIVVGESRVKGDLPLRPVPLSSINQNQFELSSVRPDLHHPFVQPLRSLFDRRLIPNLRPLIHQMLVQKEDTMVG